MNWAALELMAQGGTIALLALWSWLLWRDHRATLAARLAILMNLGIADYVAQGPGWLEGDDASGLLLGTLARTTPALLWLFARSWFMDRTRLSAMELTLTGLAIANAAVMHFAFGQCPALFLVSAVLFRGSMFAFAASAIWTAWRGRADDLIEARRRLRLALVITIALYVVAIALSEMAVYNAHAPAAVLALVGSSTVLATLILCGSMFALRPADLFGPRARPRPDPRKGTGADDPLAARLLALFAAERPYRDETLTIAALAQQLGEQEYRLRRTINRGLGFRNFAQFLNSHRLSEVKAALADPAQREVPILTIALDAGFGSLGPFNRAFREAEGITPSEFRARALADSEIG